MGVSNLTVTFITHVRVVSNVMGRINVEVSDDLHTALKVEAAEQGETLKETVISALEESVELDSTEEDEESTGIQQFGTTEEK